jgi:uncharacterized protein (DUF1697 family)
VTIYLCLLRAVNVGGRNKVDMARLRAAFERLGFTSVRTYINSGNVVFAGPCRDTAELTAGIEAEIEREFGLAIAVVVWDLERLTALVDTLPAEWVDDSESRCNVLFLWPEVDRADIVDDLPLNREVENARYLPGAVIWRVDRSRATSSRMTRLVGTDLYRKLTIRTPNTIRKLHDLMRAGVPD